MSLCWIVRRYVCQMSRRKTLKMLTLLGISLLIVNWYILGDGGVWSYKIVETGNSTLNIILGDGRVWTYTTVLPTSTNTTRTEPTTNSPSISTKTIRTEPAEPTTNSPSICPKLSLQPKNRATYGLCTPHKPSQASCKFTRQLYAIKPELAKCKKKGAGDVCKMKITKTSKGSEISFRCNPTLCQQGKRDSFKVQSVDPNTGLARIVNKFSTVMALERGLPAIVKKNKQNKFDFVFIGCTSRQGEEVSQFLPVEPDFVIKKSGVRNKGLINVVVLLIDSIARAHFYRSLPRTVATFKNWRENPDSVPAKVFDFELFQALHGHTAENTQALFAGNVFRMEQTSKKPPVNMSAMFGHYKRAGYHTIYQEDLCWKGFWGLMKDLGVRQWKDLQGKMKNTFIDHTGLTHSSCKILESLGVKSPFNGPEGDQICYNGNFQHSYFLRYTTDTLHAINKSHNARPLFSYTSLSVAHDHRSIRTQTMDIDLESYVTAMAKEMNTLTVVLSDHGNTYTSYASYVLEGRFEMFHPSLFIIVPNRVASLLGKEAMSALAKNQERLVTMIELHHSLMVLANPLSGNVKPVGLFTPIALNRTCDDLELKLPNMCVCEGWDVPADNDTSRIPIAEFAIGQLNNRLAGQSQNSKQRSCQRLQPLWFENVRERNSKTDRSLITSMDIRVKAGDVVPQKQDIFHVEVMTREILGEKSLQMTLVSFDRLTLFGKYAECADDDVDLKLCVCSQNAKKIHPEIAPPSLEGWTHFGQRPVIRKLYNTKCLWLIIWSFANNTSNAYEVANFCRGQTYRVTIGVEEAFNMKFSRELPLTFDVKPGNILFTFSVRKRESSADIKVATKVEKKSNE